MDDAVTLTRAQLQRLFTRWNAEIVAQGYDETGKIEEYNAAAQAEHFIELAQQPQVLFG